MSLFAVFNLMSVAKISDS